MALMRSEAAALVLAASVIACMPATPSEVLEPGAGQTTAPQPGQPSTEPQPVSRAHAGDCELFIDVSIDRSGGDIMLAVSITNTGPDSVPLKLHSSCPGGPTLFSGLPAGYDYYGTCNEGACIEPAPIIELTLAPGATTDVDAAFVQPGGGACQVALEPGSYEISAQLRPVGEGPRLCPGRTGVLDLGKTASPSSATTPRRECPQLGCAAACVVEPESGEGCPVCDCEASLTW